MRCLPKHTGVWPLLTLGRSSRTDPSQVPAESKKFVLRGAFLWAAVLVTALLSSTQSTAQQRYFVTGCDSVTLNGHVYPRFSFEIRIAATDDVVGCRLFMLPRQTGAPTDTCSAVRAYPPDSWQAAVRDDYDGAAGWQSTSEELCVQPGETLAGFQIALSRSSCCFDAYFVNNFFGLYGHEVVCFDCSPAVPAQDQTWGRIKVQYR